MDLSVKPEWKYSAAVVKRPVVGRKPEPCLSLCECVRVEALPYPQITCLFKDIHKEIILGSSKKVGYLPA